MPDIQDQEKYDRIARRAHALWEKEGRPEGRDKDHWAQAETEIVQVGEELPERLVPGEPADPGPVPGMTPARRRKPASAVGQRS